MPGCCVPGRGLPNSHVPQSGHTHRLLTRPPSVTPPGTLIAVFPVAAECVIGDDNADGESAARDALTVRAVACVDLDRRLGDRVADRAADAASRQWQLHGSPAFVVRVKL